MSWVKLALGAGRPARASRPEFPWVATPTNDVASCSADRRHMRLAPIRSLARVTLVRVVAVRENANP